MPYLIKRADGGVSVIQEVLPTAIVRNGDMAVFKVELFKRKDLLVEFYIRREYIYTIREIEGRELETPIDLKREESVVLTLPSNVLRGTKSANWTLLFP